MIMLQFGYACLALGVPGTQMKSCIMRNATEARLQEVIAHNLGALKRLIQYNRENDIQLFRISSDLIPFGSSPVNTLLWQDLFADTFEEIGHAIADARMRVSMHPGQYTVLNSPSLDVVERAIADLAYHEAVLRLLQCDSTSKLVLHVGGVYGDKQAVIERFCRSWDGLTDRLRSRIVLENDERSYNISDVLAIAQRLGIPAVFDNLHHAINAPAENRPMVDWLSACAKTWAPSDGRQKIHYAQQRIDGKPGAHAKTICTEEFLPFYQTIRHMDLDIMLEVKDKNLSALKCSLIASDAKRISLLEQEWAKYKYSVLERSPSAYQAIRQLLKDKAAFPAGQFYHILEQAMDEPIEIDKAVNALLHVWGYFKDVAQPDEKARFFAQLARYQSGAIILDSLKNQLHRLAGKYDRGYLLQSYFFL